MQCGEIAKSDNERLDSNREFSDTGDVVGPATPMQEVMYASAVLGTAPSVDLEHVEIDCPTGIQVERFAVALERWVQSFVTLRTGFRRDESGSLVQVQFPPCAVTLDIIDLSENDEEEVARAIANYRDGVASAPFDLARAPLVRASLFKLNGGRARVVLTLHHIVYDGRCAAEMFAELFAFYDSPDSSKKTACGFLKKAKSPTFAEFAAEVRSRNPEKSRPYFESLFAGFGASVDLRLGSPGNSLLDGNSTGCQPRVGYIIHEIQPSMMDDLARASERHGGTVNTLFQTAWAVLLGRYSGVEDVAWGTTRACRHGTIADSDRVVGMCINTVPCRLNVAGKRSLADVTGSLRKQHVEVRPHEHTSPALVQNWCAREGSGRLFNTLAVFERFVAEREVARRISLVVPRSVRIYSRPGFDLTVMLSDGENPRLELIYERANVRDAVAHRVAEHLLTLLAAISRSGPGTVLVDLPHLASERQAMLMHQAYGSPASFPRELPLQILFEQIVDANPQATCLKDDSRTFMYCEVEEWANKLAEVLRDNGIRPGMAVPVLVERSIEYVVAILAVLKAGGAYVPLELSVPSARLAKTWNTLQPELVICSVKALPQLPTSSERWIVLDEVDLSSRSGIRKSATFGELANVIFTSGSTGDPKGVMIPHRAISRLVHNSFLPFEPTDVYLLLSSVAFDASTLEIWAPLLTGAVLAIYAEEKLDFEKLRARIKSHGVTRLWLTSALFNAVIDTDPLMLDGVKTVMTGGEAVSPAHIERAQAALPKTAFVNGYGPTEGTTFTCTHAIPLLGRRQSSIPIGQPIDHTVALALDVHGYPVDTGFAGELFIGGDGLALGYLNEEQLTVEKFVTCRFAGPAERFYRSGDLVRPLPGGILDFLERLDGQIKLRGHRIDPGEIETAIMSACGAQNAAVVARGKGVFKHLIAFVVGDGSAIHAEDLRLSLKQLLPDYMQPRQIIILKQLPVTVNGKLDRTALGQIDLTATYITRGDTQPVDETERKIQEIFAEVLGTAGTPLEEGIIELGFNSLSLVDLSLRLKREFGQSYSEQVLTGNPSARNLARLMRGETSSVTGRTEVTSTRTKLIIPVGRSGRHPPLFIIPGILGDPLEISHLSKEMSRDRMVYAFRLPGRLAGETPRMRLVDLAGDLIDALESVYSTGPIYLMGYSFGATVAYEMAHQLRAKARSIQFLGLIDTPTFRYASSLRSRLKQRLHHFRNPQRYQSGLQTGENEVIENGASESLAAAPASLAYSKASQRILAECKTAAGPDGVRAVRELAAALGMHPAYVDEMHPIVWCGLLAISQNEPAAHNSTEGVHLFVSKKTAKLQARHLGWHRIVRQKLRIWRLEGDHSSIINQLGSVRLAQIFRDIVSEQGIPLQR